MKKKKRDLRWERLDNTAHLFPVIAGESMTNVYRISVTLTEEIQPELLQEALDMLLPRFDGFNLRMKQGVFWYYLEENGRPAPRVCEENTYPCRFIRQNKNNNYLFRVTYYKRRINLEVFHVLADGMGGINFLRELTYQYLRLVYPKLREKLGDAYHSDTSFNREDSFVKNYKRKAAKGYKTKKAFLIKSEKLEPGEFGVMHGYMNIPQLKNICKGYGVSINEYLVSVYVWSVYKECMHGIPSKLPIRVAVPVNLRTYFESITTKNFFVMVSAEFLPEKESYTFEEVMGIVCESLRSQINKENLEKLFSYNVSNEMVFFNRATPLFLKNMIMKQIYMASALANTTTITNIGNVTVAKDYEPYVEMFHAFLAMSKGQHLKGTICSYKETLVFNFSFDLSDMSVQRCFFRKIAADGVDIKIDSNGVNYE
ncbi:MAG: hypothetical protein IJZ44_03910 [Lachnospiraceae bacterium]|nr:hypothetical protein [Lachnospiraceae bacterium]